MERDRLTVPIHEKNYAGGTFDTEACKYVLDPLKLMFLDYEGRFCHLVCMPFGMTEGSVYSW